MNRHQRPSVLQADTDGAERVHGLLRVLCQRNLATEESFQIVMRAYVDRGRLRWRPSPGLWSDEIESNNNKDTNRTGTVLRNQKIICAADQVEVLLQELVSRVPTVSVETFNLALEAYANCATPRGGERNYAQRAQLLLRRMEEMYKEQVPVASIMHVLHATAWQQANLQPGVYANQATAYLERIMGRTDDPTILLKALSWTLEAHSKSGSTGSAPQAESLLKQMIQINATNPRSGSDDKNNTSLCILDAEDFSNAILAWSKSDDADAAEHAQVWLEEMVSLYRQGRFPAFSEPPLIAFNGVIVAWSRRGDYKKAAAVLWLLNDLRQVCQSLVPDVVSCNSVLHAYLRAKAPLEEAVTLVNFMHDNCATQPSITPNSFTYYTYLKCLLQKRQNAPQTLDISEECENSLNRLEARWLRGDYAMKPTNRIFNMIINAYAKSNEKRSWRKATNLLDRMKKMSEVSDDLKAVAPDIITITSVMECLSKASDPQVPQLVQSLLQESFDRYHETQDLQDRPNLRTYTMAILTLAKNHGSVVEARRLLDNLVELYNETGDPSLEPNAYPYNYVLNCAATTVSEDTDIAFQIATRTFQELRKAGLADSYSYAFWIKCCNNLLTSEDLQKNCVSYAFEECKRDGLVTAEVLNRLLQVLPRKMVMEELLEGKIKASEESSSYTPLTVDNLPASWSRRTRKARRTGVHG